MKKCLLSCWTQRAKGSPVKPGGQLQIGLWLTTWHLALTPQVPGQGSMHFCLTQALSWAQSELTMHSGRHVGGEPTKPVRHEHTACPLISRHWLFGPQGDGWHGFCGGWAAGEKNTCNLTEQRKIQRIKVTVRQEGTDVWHDCKSFHQSVVLKWDVFYFRCLLFYENNIVNKTLKKN